MKRSGFEWKTHKSCTTAVGDTSITISQIDVLAVNVLVCLKRRTEVCGLPTPAIISK